MLLGRRNFLHLAMGAGGSLWLPQLALAQTDGQGLNMPVPPINSPDEIPPAESSPVVLSTKPDKRMFMFADSDNSSKQNFVYDIPHVCPDGPQHYGLLISYWDGGPPAQYTMTLRQFWRYVEDSGTIVHPGQYNEKLYTHSWGISQTDSETISASLGYSSGDSGGINASISETFSHSVTTDRADSRSEKLHIDAPTDGKQRVWRMWQLVHELIALDAQGKVVPAGCRCQRDRKADVAWWFGEPKWHCGGLTGTSGASVYYQQTRWLFPSKILRPSQKDFPMS
jgi:hypothetical protein